MKNLKEAQARIEALEAQVIALTQLVHTAQAAPVRGARNYGPDSQIAMTDEMAWRIRFGDYVATPVKAIAVAEGLSHGQIYSVRGNYTFTKIVADSYFFNEEAKIVKA
jgi:hypothetical protein